MVVSSNPSMSNVTGDLECSGGVKVNNQRQKLRQRFDIVRKLGQGTYGKVQLALNKDSGEEVAIKTIKKGKIETEQDLVRIQREIQIMSSVQHPHIIHIYEVFENKEKIVLVTEYACGGELYDYLSFKKTLSESDARRIFRQVASAVYYCHKNRICHRDLKLENILLDEKGNAKIADFGLSNVFDEKRLLDTFCGSPLYASPEIVKGTPYYGPHVDCWSLGVLLYTLVYGAMPFDGSNFRRLVKQISEGDYYEPKKPSEASGLIRRLLTVSPSKRATIEDVCEDWWVNLGYDDSLLLQAEEMCKATPVRLDYLLQLVPPVIPASGDKASQEEAKRVQDEKAIPITEDNLNIQNEPNDVAMETDTTTSDDTSTPVKKHQLTSSEQSLSSMLEDVSQKRQKTNDNQVEIQKSNSEAKTLQAVTTEEKNIDTEVSETVAVDGGQRNLEQKENVSIDTTIGAIQKNAGSKAEDSEAAELCTTPSATPSGTPMVTPSITPDIDETKQNDVVEVIEHVAKKPPKKDGEEVEPKLKPKGRSASLKTPSLSPTKEKKSPLYSGGKVLEARQAFEAKPQEKRSLVIPGLKVSTARKAFEGVTTAGASNFRRASMPVKLKAGELADQKRKQEQDASSVAVEVTLPQKKTAGFLPTLDVTMAVKPKKDAGKPPPVPRTDTSTPSGTSSGENTPDASPRLPPVLKAIGVAPRRASYPKTQGSAMSSVSSIQDTESRTRTVSETDSLSLNVTTTSSEHSLKSSTSTLTGGESADWGSVTSLLSTKDINEPDGRLGIPEEIKENTPESSQKPEECSQLRKPTRVTSMEITLNNIEKSPQAQQAPKSTMAEPQLVLRQPPGGGKFTLLGVTSEVTFDVAAAPPEDESEIPTVEFKQAPPKPPKQNSSLYMSVTLPPPPPPDDESSDREDCIGEGLHAPPLSKTQPKQQKSEGRRRRETPVQTGNQNTNPEPKVNRFSSYERESGVGPAPGERYVREVSKDSEETTSASGSHQGYSVYRSKFCSLQKGFLGEDIPRRRDASIERSESFSSTGSNDDLEDIFDSLATNDSLLTNIIGRTRSLIEEFARDDITAAARRHNYNSFFRRNSGGLRAADVFSKMENARSFADSMSSASSGIGSSRSSRTSRPPAPEHDASSVGSHSSWRTARSRTSSTSTPTRDLGPDAESYFSDSAPRGRWYSRSTSREDESEASARSAASTQRRSMYSSYSRSMSNSISEEEKQKASSTTEGPSGTTSSASHYSSRRDSSSSTATAASQKRSSLSSRYRTGEGSVWDSGFSRHQSWSEEKQDQNQEQHEYSSSRRKTSNLSNEEKRGSRNRDDDDVSWYARRESSVPSSYPWNSRTEQRESAAEASSVYGTVRRTKNASRYAKSMTQELPEESCKSEETTSGRDGIRRTRPRSILVLSDPNEDNQENVESAEKKESRQRQSYRSLTSFEGMTQNEFESELKKKSDTDFESHSAQQSALRNSRFGFRRTPSQERTSESASGAQKNGDSGRMRDHHFPTWRAASHGREIPPTSGSTPSWNKSRNGDDQGKPMLVRRASLSETTAGRYAGDDISRKATGVGGAAGYWAKRYGTTSRVIPHRRAVTEGNECDVDQGMNLEECKTKLRESAKSQLPRRRSTAGFESDSELVDEGERTRGLLRYARSISHELDQLQSDLYARFRKIKANHVEMESGNKVMTRGTEIKKEVGTVVQELQKLEKDLLGFSGANDTAANDTATIAREEMFEKKEKTDVNFEETPKVSAPAGKEEKPSPKEEERVSSEDGTATPTDLDDTCSLCSDYESRSGASSGLDESVSERIRRKSYFARFQNGRRKHQQGTPNNVEHEKSPVSPARCPHRRDQESMARESEASEEAKKTEREQKSNARSYRSMSRSCEGADVFSSTKRNHFLQARDSRTAERSVSPEQKTQNDPRSPCPNNDQEIPEAPEDAAHMLRASSVVPELLEPSSSSNRNKSYLRQRSACDSLRPISPMSRRLSMLDGISSTSVTNGDVHTSHHYGTSWLERRKSRPLASILSSLPPEATVQSRANLRSRHDYLINRALSTLDERYTRPMSPTSRRTSSFHDNHLSPSSDLRRFSAILDNSSPRDVIRKALDVCNSLQY